MNLCGKGRRLKMFPNKQHLDLKHDYTKINRKLVNEKGEAVAAIMAGVDDIDVAWIWKIWVDEKYRHQGLGTLLTIHFDPVGFIQRQYMVFAPSFLARCGKKVGTMLTESKRQGSSDRFGRIVNCFGNL